MSTLFPSEVIDFSRVFTQSIPIQDETSNVLLLLHVQNNFVQSEHISYMLKIAEVILNQTVPFTKILVLNDIHDDVDQYDHCHTGSESAAIHPIIQDALSKWFTLFGEPYDVFPAKCFRFEDLEQLGNVHIAGLFHHRCNLNALGAICEELSDLRPNLFAPFKSFSVFDDDMFTVTNLETYGIEKGDYGFEAAATVNEYLGFVQIQEVREKIFEEKTQRITRPNGEVIGRRSSIHPSGDLAPHPSFTCLYFQTNVHLNPLIRFKPDLQWAMIEGRGDLYRLGPNQKVHVCFIKKGEPGVYIKTTETQSNCTFIREGESTIEALKRLVDRSKLTMSFLDACAYVCYRGYVTDMQNVFFSTKHAWVETTYFVIEVSTLDVSLTKLDKLSCHSARRVCEFVERGCTNKKPSQEKTLPVGKPFVTNTINHPPRHPGVSQRPKVVSTPTKVTSDVDVAFIMKVLELTNLDSARIAYGKESQKTEKKTWKSEDEHREVKRQLDIYFYKL